ncbi:hypothetical protein [Pseudoxanthomonas sp. JBR18]|uniref:hypothetical protein n=1 Tax=Pseudoxanthomonas sp. JBR18 TaxID=2969308 RepID=UPI002305D54F|nr:hypothetical protein [Pseudoxanthomonas sp. JBR18]WCE04420.1 hypothetical protein PJ250_20540 [Pseudoxanthomonas sp. JBR18]
MTVASNDRRKIYTGNGAALVFNGPRAFSASHIQVYLDSVLLTSGYSVANLGAVSTTITFITPPANGASIVLVRTMPLTQDTDITNQGKFLPELHEDAFDARVMQIQQVADDTTRSLKVPLTSSNNGEIPNWSALGPLVVSADGQGVEVGSNTLTGDMLLRPNLADPTVGKGADLVAYKRSATGAQQRSARDKLDDSISAFDFMTSAQRADVKAGTELLDVTSAVQAAIDYAYLIGGAEVFCPPGVYKTTSAINVKNGVIISGVGVTPYTNSTEAPKPRGGGTWFHAAHSGVAFQCNANAGSPVGGGVMVRRIGVFRTHATPGAGWAPTVYDYDIITYGVDLTVEDVCLLNAYKGIKITSAGFGRLHVNRLKMQPFNTGIDLDQSFDTCRIENVQIWPFWSDHVNVRGYTLANLKAYRISRSDNAVLSSCFSIYHNVGIYIDGDNAGNTAYALRISNCNIDPGAIGIQFTAGSDGSTALFENCIFAGADEVAGSFGMIMEGDANRVAMANCDLGNYGSYAIAMSGTNSLLRMTNVHISNWAKVTAGTTAIQVASSNEVRQANVTRSGSSAPLWGGTGLMFGYVGGGEVALATDGAGDLTITHNLAMTPRRVYVQQTEPDTGYYLRVHSRNATTFKVRVKNTSGTTVGSGTNLTVMWQAESM